MTYAAQFAAKKLWTKIEGSIYLQAHYLSCGASLVLRDGRVFFEIAAIHGSRDMDDSITQKEI